MTIKYVIKDISWDQRTWLRSIDPAEDESYWTSDIDLALGFDSEDEAMKFIMENSKSIQSKVYEDLALVIERVIFL